MAWRNLLVVLDATAACSSRVEAALALAREHGAQVVGLYCVAEVTVPTWVYVPGDVVQTQRQREEERAAATLEWFQQEAEAAGIDYETRTARRDADRWAEETALHARYADLAILGQVDPDEPQPGGPHVVEQVVLSCGRPALVVPYIGAPRDDAGVVLGRHVTVAWDAGREAARALADAMPMLERARRVDVVVVNPADRHGGHGDVPGADIAHYLARHGLEVNIEDFETHEIEAGDAILSHLADTGSDALVMGAYAHSRLREFILGGVTRTVLGQMTVPVLMSH